MADQSDVETALVAAVTAALYPPGANGTSIVGPACRVFRGWPNSAALDADLAAGRVNVTVFPVEGAARNTTRFTNEWQAAAPRPQLTARVDGQVASFAGTAALGQTAGLLVNAQAYVVRMQAGYTPELVAAALGALVANDTPAVVNGATVTIPGAWRLVARTAADATAMQELRRQEQVFRISAWCPTPALRDAVCSSVDGALSANRFIGLADGSTGRYRFRGTTTFDQSQDASLYRRDLLYAVDYPTTATATQPSMLFGDLTLGGATYFS
jgi:hypothetical protein